MEPSSAVVESFNIGHNAPQLAALLFGDQNRWGKLPVTIYSADFTTGGGGLPPAGGGTKPLVPGTVASPCAVLRCVFCR